MAGTVVTHSAAACHAPCQLPHHKGKGNCLEIAGTGSVTVAMRSCRNLTPASAALATATAPPATTDLPAAAHPSFCFPHPKASSGHQLNSRNCPCLTVRACAEVEKYQESYVCYASTGYMCEASGLSVIRTHGSAQPITARLDIVTAPAEYCLPIKKDRRFAPEFTVQARPALLCPCGLWWRSRDVGGGAAAARSRFA